MAEYIIEAPQTTEDAFQTSMRFVETGLQEWLAKFGTRVVFSPIPDAFSSPSNLDTNGKQIPTDACGAPLYGNQPAAIQYPVVGVTRKGWAFRRENTWSTNPQRRLAWTTDAARPIITDINQVIRVTRPMGWDYKFQVDYYSLRPDTQAVWVEKMMQTFWRTGSQDPQTWILIPYPAWFNTRYVRVRLVGDIDSLTPDAPAENEVIEYRASLSLTVEAYVIDHGYRMEPALKTLIVQGDVQSTTDLTTTPYANPSMVMPGYRSPLPPPVDNYGPSS